MRRISAIPATGGVHLILYGFLGNLPGLCLAFIPHNSSIFRACCSSFSFSLGRSPLSVYGSGDLIHSRSTEGSIGDPQFLFINIQY
ncbi:hypothetical protein BDV27DRAFT_132413 [Aspergillus caelatus]|uniref:Uncharacterized protein n=1 Tax=Aspergillus caelatus TaxID=61420 RepID=A0A5N6ZW45_9EURO|nr:uncharacterized protein BDV27DRAFT_132413 [Aspergillus caelatus]KAE8361831.1 hypothetical protein BDV27DRAFT_132413 [Aspergillus caelatus]